MAIIAEQSSLHYLAEFAPVRCDTHFRHHIKLADKFFSNEKISWVMLGSALEHVRNGLNIRTEFYSMEPTDILYLSVSQIKEYGLVTKNQNYLTDEVTDLESYWELTPEMILVTRSGTIGVALSTDHSSFNFDEYSYVASGFVITARVKKGFSASTIAGFINLFDVQEYLTAMAAGACQKNIAQPTINNLPIPECLLTGEANLSSHFEEYEKESQKIVRALAVHEKKLAELKTDISSSIKEEIMQFYRKPKRQKRRP